MDDAPNSSAIQRPCPLVFAGTQRFLVAVCSSRRRSRSGFNSVFQRNQAMSYAFPQEPVLRIVYGICSGIVYTQTPRYPTAFSFSRLPRRSPGMSPLQETHESAGARPACTVRRIIAPASLSCSLKLPAPQRFLAAARRRPRPAFRGLRGRRVFSPSLWAASSRLASRAPSFLSPTRTALLFSLGETLPVSQR